MMLGLERARARVSAGELAYAEAGDGPPVVLLHGFPTSADLWRREAPLLASRMRVVVPDLLGYGQSDRPAGADLTIVGQARHVDAVRVHDVREMVRVARIVEAIRDAHPGEEPPPWP